MEVLWVGSLGVGLYLIGEALDSIRPGIVDGARTSFLKTLLFGVSSLLLLVTAWYAEPNVGYTTMRAYMWAVHLHGIAIQYEFL